ncbi:MAG: menaquinone biosynthetic enzyme MqnA/MqnD family protein [Vicinamibacterales bacterium]
MSDRRIVPLRLGAVEYLNARPLVYRLERRQGFEVRYDVPSRCADLLHEGAIDVGLIPSIEYLRAPREAEYRIVPDLAIGSNGPVASVMLYTIRPVSRVRSLALDVSSRTSVALVRVFCARRFHIDPALETRGPDLPSMLAGADAALIIGDAALLLDDASLGQVAGEVARKRGEPRSAIEIEAIDLGQQWTELTGLPFVYAFWAGRSGVLTAGDIAALQETRDAGVAHVKEVAREYFQTQPERQELGERYLRDNIRYGLGDAERAGLETFYRYAAEAGVVESPGPVRFFDADTVL